MSLVKSQTIRTKSRNSLFQREGSPWGFGSMSRRMSRTEALKEIKRHLRRSPSHTAARQLITLFNIQAEELTEVGVPYEVLKVLEKRYCF